MIGKGIGVAVAVGAGSTVGVDVIPVPVIGAWEPHPANRSAEIEKKRDQRTRLL